MSLSSASQLGSIIGSLANSQSQMKEDIIPDEIDQSLILTPQEGLVITQSVEVVKKSYPLDSFILDHPVYGDIDSSTLLIDGGHWLLGNTNGTLAYYPLVTNPSSGVVSDDTERSSDSSSNDGVWTIIASGYYPFNGNATDASTSGNNGTVTGATLTTDHLGNVEGAYSFPAGNSRISIPTSTDFNLTTGVTLACWVRFKTYTSTGYMFGRYSTSTAASRSALIYKSGGSLRFYTDNGVYANLSTFITADTYSDWMHIVCTNDGTSSKIYINGVLRTTQTKALDTGSFSQEVTIGNTHTGSDSSEADMTECMWLSNVVLTAEEIAHLYNITSSHKLDKPLVTKTNSNGDSITGYEFTGQASNVSGGGIKWGCYATLPALGITGVTTHSYYGKFMMADELTGGANIIFGGRYGDANVVSIDSANKLTFRVDDDSMTHATALTRGQIYQYIVVYEYDSGTPASSNGWIYIADADGNAVGSTASDGALYDGTGFGDTAQFIGAETRYGYIMRGVISKPMVFNKLLSSDERTGLFNGTLPIEEITTYTS